jgi:hypothetical protein
LIIADRAGDDHTALKDVSLETWIAYPRSMAVLRQTNDVSGLVAFGYRGA